jgi:hypothetical protein
MLQSYMFIIVYTVFEYLVFILILKNKNNLDVTPAPVAHRSHPDPQILTAVPASART